MDCVMSLDISSPAAWPRARNAVHQRRIEMALQAFHRRYRQVVRQEAARHFALADLALSFPALLFVVAVPHARSDADALRRAVISGQSLKALARLAGLPLWLRQIRPAAFEAPLGVLPCGDLVARQMANFIPARGKHHARWLWRVSWASRWGHESFALWVAKMWRTQNSGMSEMTFAMLSLWAWYSDHPETELGRLVQKRWRMSMDWKQAAKACNSWVESVNLHLDVHIEPRLPKFRASTTAGYDFLHLATSAMLADEAMAMRNCIKTYGYDIAYYNRELWSMRKNGARVATLCIGKSDVDGLPAITEFKMADNKSVTRDVALAARHWFAQHDVASIIIAKRDLPNDARRAVWQRCLKPYWQAKRCIPRWLRLGGCFELQQI
jgi:hypothetical protein